MDEKPVEIGNDKINYSTAMVIIKKWLADPISKQSKELRILFFKWLGTISEMDENGSGSKWMNVILEYYLNKLQMNNESGSGSEVETISEMDDKQSVTWSGKLWDRLAGCNNKDNKQPDLQNKTEGNSGELTHMTKREAVL